jgi:hypothetical protein
MWLLAVVCCLVGQADSAASGETTEFQIRDRVYQIWPVHELQARGLPVRDLPTEENAAWLYLDAIDRLTDRPDQLESAIGRVADGERLADAEVERLVAYLDENREALALAARAARMDDCQFPVGRADGYPMLGSALLPAFSETRDLTRLYAARAQLAAWQGEPAAALDDCLTVARLGVHVAQSPFLISGLVGKACEDMAARTLLQISQEVEMPPEALERAAAEWDAIAARRPSWERAMETERIASLAMLEDMIRYPQIVGAYLSPPPGGYNEPVIPTQPDGWTELRVRLRRLFLPDRAVRRNLDRFYERHIELVRRDPTVRLERHEAALMAEMPAWDVYSRVLLPSLSRSLDLYRRADGNVHRARVAVALARYRHDHGRIPANPEALTPRYLKALPPDPFTGRPMTFAPSPDGRSHTGLEWSREIPPTGDVTSAPAADATPIRDESHWQRLVREFDERHRLTAEQQHAASAILRDVQGRADGLVYARPWMHGDAELDALETELMERLEGLLTREQRAAADRERSE